MIVSDPKSATDHFVQTISNDSAIRFVAVGGPTAVGKSTLARSFRDGARSRGISAYVLEGDRFLVPQKDRPHPARFPDDVYEVDRFSDAVRAIATGKSCEAPFYERDGRHTGRLAIGRGDDREEVLSLCHARACDASNDLLVAEDGEITEVIVPTDGVWILDSELSLLYEDLLPLYDLSYGIRASRSIRKAHFLDAVKKGERYPFLTLAEANAKIEGFWQTDDTLIEPTVDRADVQVVLDA